MSYVVAMLSVEGAFFMACGICMLWRRCHPFVYFNLEIIVRIRGHGLKQGLGVSPKY